MTKLVIFGGRDFTDKKVFTKAAHQVTRELRITHIISGLANGADTLAVSYAERFGYDKIMCPANWAARGKAAGAVRNNTMADIADAGLAFWDRKSRGTAMMIKLMLDKYKTVSVRDYGGNIIAAEELEELLDVQ